MITLGFTRPSKRLKDSIELATSMGFKVISAPSLEISSGDSEQFNLAENIISSGKADYVIFGSITSVEECVKAYGNRFSDIMKNTKIISIGPATSKYLNDASIKVDLMPEDFSSYGLLDLIGNSVNGKTIVIMRSNQGSIILKEGLEKKGAKIYDIATYTLKSSGITEDTSKLMKSIETGNLNVMAFTSPMSAESFFEMMTSQYGKEECMKYMSNIKIAAIGRPTSEKLESLGRKPDIIPENTTFHDMLTAIMNYPF